MSTEMILHIFTLLVNLLQGPMTLAMTQQTTPATPASDPLPVRQLLESVPDSTAVCLVVQNLGEHARTITESPFFAWFKTSAFGKSLLQSGEMKQLGDVLAFLAEISGLTQNEIRDDLLGGAIVLAYQPGPPGKPEQESGLVMLQARDAKKLAKFVDAINKIQLANAEIESVIEKKYQGKSYTERKRKDASDYIRLDEGRIFYTRQESALKLCIDQELRPGKEGRKCLKAFDELKLDSAALALLFDPRSMDAEFAAGISAATNPAEKTVRSEIAKVWKALDLLAVDVRITLTLDLRLSLRFDEKAIPNALRPLLVGSSTNSDLWSRIPEQALLTLAGQFQPLQLLGALESMLAKGDQENLKKLLTDKVVPILGKEAWEAAAKNLGPDWGVWISAPGAKDQALPIATAAFRVRSAEGKDDRLAKASLSALEFAFQSFRVEFNRTHDEQISLDSTKIDNDEIKFLSGEKALPRGLQPAFALRGDYLLISSSPEGIKQFLSKAKPMDAKPGEVLLARASMESISKYLATHKKELGAILGHWTKRLPADLEKELGDLQTLLEPAKLIEIRRRSAPGQTAYELHLELVKPLRK